MPAQRSVIDSAEAARADLPDACSKPPWLQQAHVLPFEALSADEFEVLCFLLVLRDYPGDRVLYYGKTGDLGRDIVHVTKDGRVCFVQCKRYTSNVGRDDVLEELAKLATNLFLGRYPHRPSGVAWYIVPDLTNPAADLLEDQSVWKANAATALTKHLGKPPNDDLLAFATSWWPDFDRQHALALTERVKRHRDLIEEFFALQHVITGDVSDVAEIWRKEFKAMLSEVSQPLFLVVQPVAGGSRQAASVDRSQALAAFPDASQGVLKWPQTLGDDVWIARAELHEIEHLLNTPDGSTVVLLGPPGSGKSALIARLAGELTCRGEAVLAIKADTLSGSIDSEARLSEYLRLPSLVTACVGSLSEERNVYVLIDQLDALGDLVDQKSQRLGVLLELIDKLSGLRRVHVVTSCREFEYRRDARLGRVEGESVRLKPLPWEIVEQVLFDHGVDPACFPVRCRELLQTPHNLKLYLDRQRGSEEPPVFLNLQQLLDDLWDRLLLSKSNAGERVAMVTRFADEMARREELWLPTARFDAERSLVHQLVADGMLQFDEAGRRVGFRHQTYFEHARVRMFVAEPGKLVPYVLQRQDALFVRPVLWGTLIYLRVTSPSSYEQAMRQLVAANLRPHMQFLLIQLLGESDEPTDLEQHFLQRWLDDQRYRCQAVRAGAGNAGWFERLVDTHLPVWMGEAPGDCWPTLGFLVSAMPFAEARCIAEVRKRWLPYPERDQLTLFFYQQIQSWDEGVVADVSRVIARRDLPEHVPMHLAMRVSKSRPDLAPRIIRTVLDRRLAKLDAEAASYQDDADVERRPDGVRFRDGRYEMLIDQRSGFWDLPKLAAEAPAAFLGELWPWFVQVADRLILEPHRSLRVYRQDFSLAFELEGDTFANNPMMRAFEGAVRDLATNNPTAFDTFLGEWAEKDADFLQKLLCRGVIVRSETNPEIGIDFLTADPRRLCLGSSEDRSSDSRKLLRVLGRTASDDGIRRLKQAIQDWSGYVEAPVHNDPRSRFARRKLDCEYRLGLLRSLPAERLLPEFPELMAADLEAVPDCRERDSMNQAMSVYGGVMSADQMELAADRDILNLLELLANAETQRDWSGGRDVDGDLASSSFGELAKRRPHRVARLLPGLSPERMEKFATAAVKGIGDCEDYPTPDLFSLVVILEQLGYRSTEFEAGAAHAFANRANREHGLSPETTDLLERWLNEWSDFDTDCGYVDRSVNEERGLSHSLLWGHFGSLVLPRGSFCLLQALTYGYLRRNPANYDDWLTCLERHLDRPETSYVWNALARELGYLRYAKDRTRGALVVRTLLARYPDVRDSVFGTHVMAQCRSLFEPTEYANLLEDQRDGGWGLAWLAYGELLGLSHLLGEGNEWTPDAIRRTLDLDQSSAEATLVWTGLSHTLAKLYGESKPNGRATALFEQLSGKACDSSAKALMRVFVRTEALPASDATKRLLRAVAASPLLLKNAEHDWLCEKLLDVVAYCPELVHEVCEAYLMALAPEQLEPGSAVYAAAPHLVDTSLRLQRLGEDFRERGLVLFERLLELGLTEAESTLVEIDGRFRHTGSP